MEGTQIPINMASLTAPLKNRISEKISERNAEINNNLSVIVNFLNIVNRIFDLVIKINGDFFWSNKFRQLVVTGVNVSVIH